MRVFLVATDLSIRSDRAVRRGLRLAHSHNAVCHVLHAVDDALPRDMAEPHRADAEARLQRFVEAQPHNTAVEVAAVIGDPLVVIVEAARRLDADVVLFGLHRPRPFLDGFSETTVERMVRLSRRPALLVRDPADHDYCKILAPVSFSGACARALDTARWLAPKAEIAAFHAVHLPFAGITHERPGGTMDREMTEEAMAVRSDWCEAQGLAEELCQVTPLSGSLTEVLDRQFQAFKPDLIALGTHTRGRFSTHPLGSFAAELLHDPPADILLAHP